MGGISKDQPAASPGFCCTHASLQTMAILEWSQKEQDALIIMERLQV
jgi:hypothetical protein